MTYTFGDIIQALEVMYGIPDSRRSTFAARLKHFQKLGFPRGTNTGRGHAAVYSAEHAFLLAFVLELNQLGHTPERSIALAGKVLFGVIDAIPHILQKFANPDRIFYIRIQSRMLTYALTGSKRLPIGMFSVNNGESFPDSFLQDPSVAFMNVNIIIEKLITCMATFSPKFSDELIAWANANHSRTTEYYDFDSSHGDS
ncbi:hypothetical protein ACFOON_13040 [Novosphingobium piscinae]|uniref:HTH merR-type domain-containing protein n=1 Tax=Novosphingobium piscinae TaxID=1507448 RepID=A0A7X1FZ88_9SPHN|nr:hypothetical protein [Novosphingobium piscinae]MBC2669700.1 hypothetical protein [Novosphingobium piscinae]